jgi:hypothetical protein
MAEDQVNPVAAPKKKTARCGKTCAYVTGGREPKPCKNKCEREPGHFLDCKCRTHEMQ